MPPMVIDKTPHSVNIEILRILLLVPGLLVSRLLIRRLLIFRCWLIGIIVGRRHTPEKDNGYTENQKDLH